MSQAPNHQNTNPQTSVASDIAKILKDCEAIFINTKEFFTYSSGIKSPIYCDNRVLISHPKERKIVANHLAQLIRDKYKDAQLIAATATGAIAHGAWVADILNLPMVYILSKSKSHGRAKMIEGAFARGDKCIVVEDLISSGGSSIAAVGAAREHGLDVLGVASIFSYELDSAVRGFGDIGCEFCSLSGFSALESLLDAQQMQVLRQWQSSLNAASKGQ